MKSGRRRLKPEQAPSPRWIVRGGTFLLNEMYLSYGARSRSGHKIARNYEMWVNIVIDA